MMRKTLMLILTIGLVGWLGSAVWANETPTSYKVTLYKTELSSDNGSTWVTVLDNASGQMVDLVSGAGNAFGPAAAVPLGTYNVIRFTIKNEISYSSVSLSIPETPFTPYSGAPAQVPVYFATSGTFSWSNNGATIGTAFPLPAPIVVSSDATSKIIMNFGVTNSLYNVGPSWYLNPPVISVSCVKVQTGAAAPFAGGPYYFIRQSTRIPADAAVTITPTDISFESGWGVITMTPSATDPSLGSFEIAVGNQSWHYRYLGYFGTYAYAGGAIETGTDPMTGTYYVDADGYINMLIPDSDIIRGAVRDDDRVFIAIEISTPMSQTAYEEVGYHMIYAIQKETCTPGPVVGDYLYNGYQTVVTTATDSATLVPLPDKYSLRYQLSVGYFRGVDALTGASTETSNKIEINRPISRDAQTVTAPSISDWGPETGTGISIDDKGKWSGMNDMWGASLNDGTVSIIAGSIIDPWEERNDMGVTYTGNAPSFWLALKPAPIGVTPTVTGTYTLVYRGDYWDTGMGNQLPGNWTMLGNVTLAADGTVTGRFTRCERGAIVMEDISSTTRYEVVIDNVGSTTETIQAYAVRVYDTADSSEPVRMFICSDGKTLSPYSPPRTGATPNKERGLGLAIKTR